MKARVVQFEEFAKEAEMTTTDFGLLLTSVYEDAKAAANTLFEIRDSFEDYENKMYEWEKDYGALLINIPVVIRPIDAAAIFSSVLKLLEQAKGKPQKEKEAMAEKGLDLLRSIIRNAIRAAMDSVASDTEKHMLAFVKEAEEHIYKTASSVH